MNNVNLDLGSLVEASLTILKLRLAKTNIIFKLGTSYLDYVCLSKFIFGHFFQILESFENKLLFKILLIFSCQQINNLPNKIQKFVLSRDVDPDPVGSAFIWWIQIRTPNAESGA